MKNVSQLLDHKGRSIWSVKPTTSVFDALRIMADKEIGALVVMEDQRLVGVLSERDYARKVILMGRYSKDTTVGEIMTPDVLCAKGDNTVEECMALMTDKHIRHLPVIDGDRVIGMLSIGDLVKAIIAEQKFMIEQLEHYISGG